MLEWTDKRGKSIHAVKTGQSRPTMGTGVQFVKPHRKMDELVGTLRAYNREHIGVFDTFEEAKAARDEKIATL